MLTHKVRPQSPAEAQQGLEDLAEFMVHASSFSGIDLGAFGLALHHVMVRAGLVEGAAVGGPTLSKPELWHTLERGMEYFSRLHQLANKVGLDDRGMTSRLPTDGGSPEVEELIRAVREAKNSAERARSVPRWLIGANVASLVLALGVALAASFGWLRPAEVSASESSSYRQDALEHQVQALQKDLDDHVKYLQRAIEALQAKDSLSAND